MRTENATSSRPVADASKSDVLDRLATWLKAPGLAQPATLPRVASLFGKNKLRDLAQIIPTDQIQDHLKVIQAWVDDYHTGSLKTDKETSREQAYNNDIFMTVLGYKQQPNDPHTFEPKATTQKKQFPDALISYTNSKLGIENVSAVVELKGAAVDLDRPQQREGNLSPVQQAFKYKPQYRTCPFVIVSNFYEFRLYNDNQLDYERWTLDDLVDPADDYLKFKTFHILLRASSMTSISGKPKTEVWLASLRQEQEEIGKKFYEEYSAIRLFLLKDIWANNPSTRFQFSKAIQKAQTIIDRIVFACFAEDSGLLPDNITASVIKEAKDSQFNLPFFDYLRDFFRAIDQGKATLGIPQGYNGGLFAEDKWIDALKISDGPLIRLMKLGKYDFVNDLSVNILGHIFEQSINDLEEIKEKINLTAQPESVFEPQPKRLSRRKQDGIYYTPGHVVRYIVDRTVGAHLRAAEERYKTEFRLTQRVGETGYAERERRVYLRYQIFLQSIRVVDPACGSGAFLVHVFDYLLAENQRVDAILGGNLGSVEEHVRDILRNNIYGVDLNEESVEITKLSLWLKTAQRGKQLTTLDHNIQCGNSLVSDETIVGDKAFNWQTAFPEVFADGGFDIVVGNPPYGASIDELQRKHLEATYSTYEYQLNSYSLFYERGMEVLRPDGLLGFITPATFTYQKFFTNLRTFMQKYTMSEIHKYAYEVFDQADVGDSVSWIMRNTANAQGDIGILVSYDHDDVGELSVRAYDDVVRSDGSYMLSESVISIEGRVPITLLGDCATITMGVKPYQVGKGTPKQTRDDVMKKSFTSDKPVDATYISCLIGRDFHRYRMTGMPAMYLSYGRWLAEPRDNAPFFDAEKIVLRQTADSLIGYLDCGSRVNLNNVYNVGRLAPNLNIRYVLGLLNSQLLNYVYQEIAQEKGRLFAEVKKNYLEKLPVADASQEIQDSIAALANIALDRSEESLQLTLRFKEIILSQFKKIKWPSRDSLWFDQSFADFADSLGRKLDLMEKDSLYPLWKKYSTDCHDLNVVTGTAISAIDEMVFQLYQVTPDEQLKIKSALLK